MKLPKELTTVTPFSKFLAMAIFIILPCAAFYLGISYQKSITMNASPPQVAIGESTVWKKYESGKLIPNSDFSVTYPEGWHFKYRKGETIKQLSDNGAYRITFNVSPPEWKAGIGPNEWSGYAGINVDVYPDSLNLNKWISSFLPGYENRLIIKNKTIGNKTGYLLTGKSDADKNLDLAATFAHRYIILGKNHSYDIGFGNDGTVGSIERIQNEIFPGIRFVD